MVTAPDPSGKARGRRAPRFAREKPAVRRRLLIEAAIRCLGEGGMSGFTIDRICREAKVSRGLINHYFKSKDDLLVAAYDAMTDYLPEVLHHCPNGNPVSPINRLVALVEVSFDPEAFEPSQLKAWLTLWGEVTTNPALQALHRKRYQAYREGLVTALSAIAEQRGRKLDAKRLASKLVALIDGLWLEWYFAPDLLSADEAKAACYDLVEVELGPIER